MRLLRTTFFLLRVAQGLLRAQHSIASVFRGAFGAKKRFGNSVLSYNVVAPMPSCDAPDGKRGMPIKSWLRLWGKITA